MWYPKEITQIHQKWLSGGSKIRCIRKEDTPFISVFPFCLYTIYRFYNGHGFYNKFNEDCCVVLRNEALPVAHQSP